MQSAWNDSDAGAAVAIYENLGRDLALRVYTTRLLGQDPRLVLHGGGNTSVTTRIANLIDPAAPNPSVEALLHAFIPHKFVDHTHSTAVLALTDQPDGEALCREVYGVRVGYVPYVMPGFGLAKAAAQVFDGDPSVEGLILVKHGIFSFGADAKESYERMIALVTLAEARLAKNRKPAFSRAKLPDRPARLADVAPVVRGACS